MLHTDRKGEWCEIATPIRWSGKTIEEIFRLEWEAPKKLTHFFRTNDKVRLNGKKANWTTPLTPGMKLQIHYFQAEESDTVPSYMEVPVIYEDDHLIVFNKPSGMNTHPNTRSDLDTLANAAIFYLQSKGECRNARHVHRLDRETSGSILFAKHEMAGALLDRKLLQREIKRTYIARVDNLFKKKNGIINIPIGRDRHHPTRRRVSNTGQAAITHYQVIKEDKQNNSSFVKCWLETGRTHQIRVHLSHIGNPITGDTLYGGKSIGNRVALHAAKLEFKHPFTEVDIICFAPFPDDTAIFKGIDVYSL